MCSRLVNYARIKEANRNMPCFCSLQTDLLSDRMGLSCPLAFLDLAALEMWPLSRNPNL